MKWLRRGIAWLRHVSGDDAYERYLQHYHMQHEGCTPLDRKAFYLHEQQRKWTGVKRCC